MFGHFYSKISNKILEKSVRFQIKFDKKECRKTVITDSVFFTILTNKRRINLHHWKTLKRLHRKQLPSSTKKQNKIDSKRRNT